MVGTTIFGISKTTAAGWLSGIIGTCGPLAAYLATLPNHPRAAEISGAVTAFAAVARIWLGIITGDAPTGK